MWTIIDVFLTGRRMARIVGSILVPYFFIPRIILNRDGVTEQYPLNAVIMIAFAGIGYLQPADGSLFID